MSSHAQLSAQMLPIWPQILALCTKHQVYILTHGGLPSPRGTFSVQTIIEVYNTSSFAVVIGTEITKS